MLITLLCLVGQVLCQSQPTLNQPPYLETNTYTLRKTSAQKMSLSSTINFMQNYNASNTIPQVATSLASLYTFTPLSKSSLIQSIEIIEQSYFILNYQFQCSVDVIKCTFTQIDIVYVAYDYTMYPFIEIYTFTFTLDPAITYSNQYYQMQYLNPLQSNNTYQLNMIMAGFINLQLTDQPTLYIDAIQNNTVYYMLKVQFNNLVVKSIQLVRILLDVTSMNNAWVSVQSLTSQSGTVILFQDPLVIENNLKPDYVRFGLFYGIKGFTAWNITLAQMSKIFINVIPKMQANIGYILFLSKLCSDNQGFVRDQNLCYNSQSAFYYQASSSSSSKSKSSSKSLKKCSASCYQCSGPLATSCKGCVQGYNRYLSGGKCICNAGFYDTGDAVCMNCSVAMPNCQSCSNATNCDTCLPGCILLSFGATLKCDCAWLVQNLSTNCPMNLYYEYQKGICQCYPQTYYSIETGMCLPCYTGCYICMTNDTYCLVCLDMYTLVKNTCIYFYTSYSLLGLIGKINSPQLKCLSWSLDNTKCLSTCQNYYYQQNCYMKCPIGTFNVSFPSLSCQPCKISCLFCYNFSICYQCATQYYYYNSTIIACSSCSANCVKCLNNTFCTLCEGLYQLSNGSCGLPQLPQIPQLLQPSQFPQISQPVYTSCGETCVSCFVQQICQKCRATYYLNISSGSCINCINSIGLVIGTGGICLEICGDGLMINHECDDRNQISGDGCSSTCMIEDYFQCTRINNRSYCWKKGSSIYWTIYTVFGRNQIIIDVWSNTVVLSQNLIDVSCNFNYTLQSKIPIQNIYRITVDYHESILMFLNPLNNNTKNYFLTGNVSNMCWFTVNKLKTYQILINTFPESLYISYESMIETMIQSSRISNIATFLVIACLCFSVIGLAPLSSFSSLRIYILIIVSYMDYSQIPINSFVSYTVLNTLLFTSTSNTTSYLSQFDSNYYYAVLWRIFLLYMTTIFIHEIIIRFIQHISKKRNWNVLNKIISHVIQNKQLIYQTIYSSYEIVIYIILIRTIVNFNKSITTLNVFVFIHLIFLIITKIHFHFTKEIIEKTNYRFYHTLMIDNLQNGTIGLFIQFSTQNASFTSLLITIYALFSFVSLFQSSPPAYISLHHQQTFSVTQTICSWQYRFNLLLLIIIQIMKLTNMWKGIFISDTYNYEYLGELCGIVIVIAIYLLILLGMLFTVIIQIMRLYEINAIKGEEEISGSEVLPMQVSAMVGLDN